MILTICSLTLSSVVKKLKNSLRHPINPDDHNFTVYSLFVLVHLMFEKKKTVWHKVLSIFNKVFKLSRVSSITIIACINSTIILLVLILL